MFISFLSAVWLLSLQTINASPVGGTNEVGSIYPHGGAFPPNFNIPTAIRLRYLPYADPKTEYLFNPTALQNCANAFIAQIRALVTPTRPATSELGKPWTGERDCPALQCRPVNLFFGAAKFNEITLEQAIWSLQAIAAAAVIRGVDGQLKFNEEARIESNLVIETEIFPLVTIILDYAPGSSNSTAEKDGEAGGAGGGQIKVN